MQICQLSPIPVFEKALATAIFKVKEKLIARLVENQIVKLEIIIPNFALWIRQHEPSETH